MKFVPVLLLVVVLSSCAAGGRPVDGSRIMLETADISRQEFFLMSVREHALVVSPYTEEFYHIDATIAASISIPFEHVRYVGKSASDNWRMIGICSAAGLVSGAYIGDLVRPSTQAEIESGVRSFEFTKETYLGMLSGLALGATVGYLSTHRAEQVFDLGRPEDVAKLRHSAIYHDEEPPELAKIR